MKSLLFVCSLLLSGCQNNQPDTVRLMTYNIRYNNPGDGPNWWEHRKAKVTGLILRHAPDVLGVQEALHGQMMHLDSFLTGYAHYGAGRDDGKTKGEYAAVFFKKDKFDLMAKGTFWLSEMPDSIGSVGWDASMERICSWVQLRDKISRNSFFVFNAHFDHIGQEARKNSARLVMEKTRELAAGAPVVFMGDLNFTPDAAPYDIVLENGFSDTYDQHAGICTFRGFETNTNTCQRIDYIFTNGKWKTESFFIDDQNDGQYFPSDHLPVVVSASY